MNKYFIDRLIISPVSDKKWMLGADYRYCGFPEAGLIVVPKGFVTDFASIPRILWNILPPWEADYGPPAIIHDYLYQKQTTTRKRADDIFYRAMKQQGAGWLKRRIIYWGVRLGGWVAWNSHRKENYDKETVTKNL